MDKQQPLDIALIGCGKMGSALLSGWIHSDIENRVHVLDPGGLPEEFRDYSPNPVTHYKSTGEFLTQHPPVNAFVLAVKPQIMADVCTAIKPAVTPDKLVLSIAAGQKINNFSSWFGDDQPVVRAMPNTPAAIHKGITGAVANRQVTAEQKSTAYRLLKAVGDVIWLGDESKMDAVTALSGSGPAYFFRFTEALAEAGTVLGLSFDEAMALARATFEGAAALSEAEAQIPLARLRENVTSPGGTTAAALAVFNQNAQLQNLLNQATTAAAKRGNELSG